MKKLILLLSILTLSCSKDEEAIQQYDCGCETVMTPPDDNLRNGLAEVRICELGLEFFDCDDCKYPMVKGKTLEFLQIASKQQGCN